MPLDSRCSEIRVLYVVSLDPFSNASQSPELRRREGSHVFLLILHRPFTVLIAISHKNKFFFMLCL